ncbi:MAG TPA: molybdenum cofactor biosynthesis protein MoaE [Sphingomicrobium sp.]|jgi:molybdopterin synthase catalytic subunit|nr:molybdenum cofactor biosynthesis protein MoaE [Sphingomicrobium sp.]
MIRITGDPVDGPAELRRFLSAAGEGAVATFIGTVRGKGGVETLTLDHYAGFTEKEIAAAVDRLVKDFELSAATVVHRHGAMQPGDTILFAATAAPHRRAALDALDRLVDELKIRAPFWKKEVRGGAEHWLEPPPIPPAENRA